LRHATVGVAALAAALLLTIASPRAATAQDQRITIGGQQQDLESLTGESEAQLRITGFGIGSYTYDGKTRDNSFAAGKLALSAFRELNNYLWVFGQLTTALEQPEPGADEIATSTEIDNLIVSATVPGATNLNFSFGKFDVPVGFERDDEPLNLQATTSFNFELARPAKMVGLVGRWALSPKLDLTGLVSNGWESQIDPNHAKSGAVRIGLLPAEGVSLGVSGIYGPEGEADATNNRYLVDVDYAFQPIRSVIVAGEANYGGDRGVLAGGGDATWKGATITLFVRPLRRIGITGRAEVFDDPDGARTGQAQTLESYTIAPMYFLGVGREGIFANVEHTTFRIPRFQLRAELRFNHSSEPFFPLADGTLSRWGVQYTLQLVTVL
jgi:hypothetical protein